MKLPGILLLAGGIFLFVFGLALLLTGGLAPGILFTYIFPIGIMLCGTMAGTVGVLCLIGKITKEVFGKNWNRQIGVSLNQKKIRYLFKKDKRCPVCNGNLIRGSKMIDKGRGPFDITGITADENLYEYVIEYTCQVCAKKFLLDELSGAGFKKTI